MTRFWLCFVLISYLSVLIASEYHPDNLNLATNDANKKTCTKELKKCSLNRPASDALLVHSGLKGDKGDVGEAGEKGDRGQPGFQGPPGPVGEAGRDGNRGAPGSKGQKGDKGSKGDDGLPGNQGFTGNTGEKGDKGSIGLQGKPGKPGSTGSYGSKGSKGDPGQDGPKGPIGEKGPPGLQGSVGKSGSSGIYPCTYPKGVRTIHEDYEGEDVEYIGNEENPFNIVCKEVNAFDNSKPSTYDKVMTKDLIKIKCVIDAEKEIHTCITPQNNNLYQTIFSSEETASWLSNKDFNADNFYSLTREQLRWFQHKSDTAYQKVRYVSNSLIPFNASDVNNTLLMLSHNDITFGPNPSETTPFTYKVISNNNDNGYRELILKIESDSTERLPVMDFYIGDVGGEQRNITIENLELCFN